MGLSAVQPPPKTVTMKDTRRGGHKHLTTFHGVYAPNARLRPLVMRGGGGAHDALPPSPQPELLGDTPAPPLRPPRLAWATLQARTFGTDVWTCPCGGRRRVLALVSSPYTAQEVLQRLGLLDPRPPSTPHGPARPTPASPSAVTPPHARSTSKLPPPRTSAPKDAEGLPPTAVGHTPTLAVPSLPADRSEAVTSVRRFLLPLLCGGRVPSPCRSCRRDLIKRL
jgi:hypothetical protein